jgi:bis(5'-nucleosyl)-tetraphosphatase (symmetrical)
MRKFVVGDIQGCFSELMELLTKVNFNEKKDHLICAGDITNRGDKSLETISFLADLPNCTVTLGNHDIHLLREYYTERLNECSDTLDEIINAKNAPELCNWLRHQPFIYYDQQNNIIVSHAGIYPKWNIQEAITYATELANALQGSNYINILRKMRHSCPIKWSDDLTGFERLNFFRSCFTLMRYVIHDCELNFDIKCNPKDASKEYYPWFNIKNPNIIDHKIIFGHWSTLKGTTNSKEHICLDTGCAWGGELTIINLETLEKTSVNSKQIKEV